MDDASAGRRPSEDLMDEVVFDDVHDAAADEWRAVTLDDNMSDARPTTAAPPGKSRSSLSIGLRLVSWPSRSRDTSDASPQPAQSLTSWQHELMPELAYDDDMLSDSRVAAAACSTAHMTAFAPSLSSEAPFFYYA